MNPEQPNSTSTSIDQEESNPSINLEEYDFEELGYDYLHEPNENLICPICTNPFVDPVMCESTDHVFCRLCLIKSLELSSTCPIDRLPLSISMIQPAPKIIMKLVDELLVTCPFKDKFQCPFLSQRYLIKSHTDSHVGEQVLNSKANKKPLESQSSFPFEVNHAEEGFQFEWNQGKIQRKAPNPTLGFITRSEQDQFYKRSYPSASSSPLSSSPSSSSTGSPRTRSITSNSFESISTSSTPPNESPLISCPYQKFGCTYTCQTLEEIQTIHLSSSSIIHCEFEPISEILKTFNKLEHENQELKMKLSIAKTNEIGFKRIIESCNLSLKELWEQVRKLSSAGSSNQAQVFNNHMRYDPITGNRIPPNPQLNLNPDGLPTQFHHHFNALWNRIRELEFELIRVNESGLHLHELVRNLTRLQINAASNHSTDPGHANGNKTKQKGKGFNENEIWNANLKNSGRSFVKL